jgi:hypothetical protein
VLVVYVGLSWGMIAAAGTLGDALGLPDWFPRLALGLLIVGAPIVLATAFVQQGGPGGASEGSTKSDARPTSAPGPSPPAQMSTAHVLAWRSS